MRSITEPSVLAFLIFTSLGCKRTGTENTSYTLYRDSIAYADARIHVATFDTDDGNEYNQENCKLGSKLYQNQNAVKTAFWCEKGFFRK